MAIYKLENQVMNYAWGTRDYIPELLGTQVTEEPVAELWMGAHPKAPSKVLKDGRRMPLARLDFLLKVLSADQALSIQVHPNKEQAEIGIANEQNILDMAKRNYLDRSDKPEMFFALTDFWALIGFRTANDIRKNVKEYLGQDFGRDTKEIFKVLIRSSKFVDVAVNTARNKKDDISKWIIELSRQYPGDVGVLAPLYLNLLRLKPGDVLFAPSGVLHSYLKGSIIELMKNSDNTIRGGLTSKNIDVKELLSIVNFSEHDTSRVNFEAIESGKRYEQTSDFYLDVIELDGRVLRKAQNDEIVLCTEGCAYCGLILEQGESAFIEKGTEYVLDGNGRFFIAGSE